MPWSEDFKACDEAFWPTSRPGRTTKDGVTRQNWQITHDKPIPHLGAASVTGAALAAAADAARQARSTPIPATPRSRPPPRRRRGRGGSVPGGVRQGVLEGAGLHPAAMPRTSSRKRNRAGTDRNTDVIAISGLSRDRRWTGRVRVRDSRRACRRVGRAGRARRLPAGAARRAPGRARAPDAGRIARAQGRRERLRCAEPGHSLDVVQRRVGDEVLRGDRPGVGTLRDQASLRRAGYAARPARRALRSSHAANRCASSVSRRAGGRSRSRTRADARTGSSSVQSSTPAGEARPSLAGKGHAGSTTATSWPSSDGSTSAIRRRERARC